MVDRAPISFREKSAWVSFVLIFVVLALYLWTLAGEHLGFGTPDPFHAFLGLVVMLVVGEIVMHVLLAVRDPRGARTPKDERERLIELKATRIAFYVLLVTAFSSIGWMHVSRSAWVLGNSVFVSVVVAELVKYGSQIVYFRQDA